MVHLFLVFVLGRFVIGTPDLALAQKIVWDTSFTVLYATYGMELLRILCSFSPKSFFITSHSSKQKVLFKKYFYPD